MEQIFVKNHNNRLSSNVFGVIYRAPSKPISVTTDLTEKNYIYNIVDENQTVFKAQIISLLRFEKQFIPESIALLTQGVSPDKLIDSLIDDYQISPDDPLALYVFKKI